MPKTETPQEAAELSIDHMEKGAGLPFAEGTRTGTYQLILPRFEDPVSQEQWPTYREKVLTVAGYVGKIAEMLARSGDRAEITTEHLADAMAAVKQYCTAGVRAVKYRWCP